MATSAPYSDFVRLLAPGVRRAAEIARALEGHVPNVPKLGEATAVKQALTEADTAAQEALLEALVRHFPKVRLEAEEDTKTVASFPTASDALVVIDPVDGTLRSYLEAAGPYAVIVGLVVRGRYEAGLVALPREGLLFGATRGEGACSARPGGPLRPARANADGDRVLVSHGMPKAVVEHLQQRGLEVVSACGGAVAVAPLILGVRAGLRFAPGERGVSTRGRVGLVIARESGAFVAGGAGEFPDDLDTPAPILRVAADEADLELLRDALVAGGLAATA